MKKIQISILALGIFVFATSCEQTTEVSTDTDNGTEQEIVTAEEVVKGEGTIAQDIDANKFKEFVDAKSGQLIDVRTPGEVANGTIDGAVNIDFKSSDFGSQIETLDKNEPVYVFCHSGGRSAMAMAQMKNAGFKEVYNLLGGYSNWPFK